MISDRHTLRRAKAATNGWEGAPKHHTGAVGGEKIVRRRARACSERLQRSGRAVHESTKANAWTSVASACENGKRPCQLSRKLTAPKQEGGKSEQLSLVTPRAHASKY